jgi:ribonuclease D
MDLITDNGGLAEFCQRQHGADFIAVDTEFMRERTFWPILCLVQIAGPSEAAAIDTMAEGIDLKPLLALMNDAATPKVFHAARQDLEIFFFLSGQVPHPVFDTQIAAMVCGFGDSVSYETLVKRLAGASLDKASRFTDWAHRPLTERQLKYALADVVHLRTVYERLQQKLTGNGRAAWFEEEMADLVDPGLYRTEPDLAWRRFRLRGRADRRFLAVLRAVAAWREAAAQQRDLPRGRIMRDEAVIEIATHVPRSIDQLARTRSLPKGVADGRLGQEILDAVASGLADPNPPPPAPAKPELPSGLGPLVELFRVLLKQRCEDFEVAQKLVASADDLEAIAATDDAPVRALHGWRHEVFGHDALALKHGKLALTAGNNRIELVPLPERSEAADD